MLRLTIVTSLPLVAVGDPSPRRLSHFPPPVVEGGCDLPSLSTSSPSLEVGKLRARLTEVQSTAAKKKEKGQSVFMATYQAIVVDLLANDDELSHELIQTINHRLDNLVAQMEG